MMRFIEEKMYDDIIEDKDLNSFMYKYIMNNNPGTIDDVTNEDIDDSKRRSLTDLMNLWNSYNPDDKVTQKEIVYALNEIKMPPGEIVYMLFCTDINRVVVKKANIEWIFKPTMEFKFTNMAIWVSDKERRFIESNWEKNMGSNEPDDGIELKDVLLWLKYK